MSIDPTIDYSKRKNPPKLNTPQDPPGLDKPRTQWLPTLQDGKEWGYALFIFILWGIIFVSFWTLVGVLLF